ncbi:uncharacterized protein LOC129987815 isoform X1 [Argiope bruennichi]|uniref:uncharacterized protein LOC129987815 isoform X1 n=2 Tax=Argiope bruennichi TaxID=94029 RepID=UPI0024956D9B|nr:uncharacterized protein LOC129987815 isoform X1 [Argiope bruennichi]
MTGSPVVFLQEPRRLTVYMAAVSRRRRFIILIVICCLSLFIFGWYSRTSDNLLKLSENSSPSNEIFASQRISTGVKRPQHLPPPEVSQKENELMDFVEDDKISFRRSDEELVSGPTEYDDIPISRSYKRLPNDMELFSGPTDYDDIPITFPARRHPDLELEFSGPTEFEIPLTLPVRRHPDAELEFSGPTEEYMVGGAKHVTPPMQNNEIERSDVHKEDSYQKLSLQGTTPSSLHVTQPVKDSSLVLDTPGCKVPKLDPWDPTVKHLIELQEPYECPGPPLFMKPSSDGSITLNETVLEKYYDTKSDELKCVYQPIYRKHEDPGNVRENDFITGNASELHFGIPLNEDYVGAVCTLKDKTFEQYFPLVRLKKEIEDVRSSLTPPKPRLNIILAGIDSISKLNYLRHFRKTEAFIKEKLSMFEMNGYTKVGDNTFPNLVPMLTGHFVEHYWNESLRDTMYFDNVDLIWKDYAKKGYRTFYAEDSPYTGTFNYIKRGFYDPPTDYYLRPLLLALESSNIREKTGKNHCFNSQLEPELIYDYLRNFIEAMGNRPYIAFAMVSTITHDYLNHAGWEDQPTVHILENLLNMGALNNSLLVLFSDHGLRFGQIRYTYIGKFEERMPFMYIHAPKWFLDQYPQYAKNLEINQNRLMTLFDIHATMIHLLDLNRSAEERAELTMGKSLLEEISPNRTCEEANILPHWCPCQTFENVPLNSTEAVNASQAIVDDINSKLAEYGGICEILEVAEIMDARVGQANDLVLRFIRHDNVVVNRTVVLGDRIKPIGDYMITLVTKPGNAVFEGTVRHDPENNSYAVLGISRISLYGKTSWCIDSQKMKIFCYCKVQQAS